MWIFQKDFGIIMNKCVYWNRFTVFISSNQAFFVLIVVVLKMCVGPHSALREIITNCDNLPWCPVYLIWILNFNTCTFQTLNHDFTKSSKKKKKKENVIHVVTCKWYFGWVYHILSSLRPPLFSLNYSGQV